MVKKSDVAADMFKACGADITPKKLAEFKGCSQTTAKRRLAGVKRYDGKSCYYRDVVDALWQRGI